MRVAVVGAGAWGLPAAARLAERGHDVTLIEQFAVPHPFGSSSGDSRIWRLTHADPVMVRLALRSVEAWHALESQVGEQLIIRRGILWRGSSAPAVAVALTANEVVYDAVDAGDVGRFFPGLRPNGSLAIWQGDAGTVLAARSLAAHHRLFAGFGGKTLASTRVVGVDLDGPQVDLSLDAGGVPASLVVDRLVIAAGPWAQSLLASIGVDVALEPVLEQVAYFAVRHDAERLPAHYEAPTDHEPGLYSMPVPGLGYKIGLDDAIGAFDPANDDRTPDLARSVAISERVARDFGALDARVLSAAVCSWTDSPDGRFIIDTVHDGRVTIACGDSGSGFKWSAFFGHVLADLVEGHEPDADIASFGLARLADLSPGQPDKRFLQ